MNFLLEINFTKISFMHIYSICATQSRKRSRADVLCVDIKTNATTTFKLKYLTKLCSFLFMTPEITINNRKMHSQSVSFWRAELNSTNWFRCVYVCAMEVALEVGVIQIIVFFGGEGGGCLHRVGS